jgi:GPH family glycoside/pentoside/hexuronide:cation symporter
MDAKSYGQAFQYPLNWTAHFDHHRRVWGVILAEPAEALLPVSTRVQWGVGGFGAALLMNAVGGLVLYYLTRMVGVSGWLAGLLLSAARLYDAFLDPAIGQISDRTNSRYGRRRPYMLAGAFLSAISIVLVFTTPFKGVSLISTSYVLLTLVLYGTAYSIFNVPYVSMPAEMTSGYHERSALHGWRVMFASAGSAVAGSGSGLLLAWLAAPRTPKGHVQVNTAQDYSLIAVIYAVVILVSMLIAWRGTKYVPVSYRTERTLPWKQHISTILENGPFWLVLGAKIFQLVGIASSQAASFFFLVEVLKVGSGGIALLGLPSILFSFLITPVLVRLSKRIGKKGGYFLAAAFTGAAYASWVWAAPGDPSWMLIVRGLMLGVGFSGNVLFALSMLADTIEVDFHRTGLRREGLYTSLYSFVEKFSGALGPALVGAALSLAGFEKSSTVTPANYEAVRQATLFGMAYLPGFCALVALGLIALYRLTPQDVEAERARAQAAVAGVATTDLDFAAGAEA